MRALLENIYLKFMGMTREDIEDPWQDVKEVLLGTVILVVVIILSMFIGLPYIWGLLFV